jgi:hypothetical protein
VFGSTSSTVNLVSQVNGSTLTITDVQFEVGSFCTTFERKLYDQVLRECQRYLYVGTGVLVGVWDNAISQVLSNQVNFPATMRASPTVSGVTSYSIGGVTASATGLSIFTTPLWWALSGTSANGQGDGLGRQYYPNQTPVFSAQI